MVYQKLKRESYQFINIRIDRAEKTYASSSFLLTPWACDLHVEALEVMKMHGVGPIALERLMKVWWWMPHNARRLSQLKFSVQMMVNWTKDTLEERSVGCYIKYKRHLNQKFRFSESSGVVSGFYSVEKALWHPLPFWNIRCSCGWNNTSISFRHLCKF